MKSILGILFFSMVGSCYAATPDVLVSKSERVIPEGTSPRASYRCMQWFDSGYMKIKKNANKATFSNGYIKFNKNAKVNAMLSLPSDYYCVGDRMVFKKTFGSRAVTITGINIK